MNPDLVLAEARQWLGTPYVHRASCKGAGADCLGFLLGLCRALYGPLPLVLPPYHPHWAETGPELLQEALGHHLRAKALAEAALADVLLFRVKERGPAKHLGLQSALGPAPRFLHAYGGHGVCESALSAPWARRLVARYDFPEDWRR